MKITFTAQKMRFSIKDLFSKCENLVTFTEEILNGTLHFLSSVSHGIFALLKGEN